MALSGTINGSVSQNSGIWKFWVEWSVTNDQTDRIATNSSVVQMVAKIQKHNTYASGWDTVREHPHWLKMIEMGDSTTTHTDSWSARCNHTSPTGTTKTWTVRTWSKRIYHNSDGSKKLKLDAYYEFTGTYGGGNCYLGSGTGTDGVEITLDTIPRALSRVMVGGTWRNSSDIYVKVSGVWRKVNDIYVKVDGSWRRTKW